MNAAWQLSMHSDVFRAYYDLKRSAGLGYYTDLDHVAHKFVLILFKLFKSNIPFDEIFLFTS